MRDWDTDIAVMFYAPWCKYCKQLTPYMEQMAYQLKDNSNIMVGKFNCEEPASNNIVCQTIGVTHYPSVYFIGYGNFHQSPMGKLFGKSKFERIVHYRADLHPEAIYDWINMLKMISFIQRKWDDFLSIFNPSKSRTLRKIKTLENSISVLTATSEKYKSELESYKADELFDSLEDKGDPFPLLSSIPPDEQNRPLRVCVAEMAEEYCRYHNTDEPYCTVMDKYDCAALELTPKECRPNACPFNSNRGKKVVSICVDPKVLKKYKEETMA